MESSKEPQRYPCRTPKGTLKATCKGILTGALKGTREGTRKRKRALKEAHDLITLEAELAGGVAPGTGRLRPRVPHPGRSLPGPFLSGLRV